MISYILFLIEMSILKIFIYDSKTKSHIDLINWKFLNEVDLTKEEVRKLLFEKLDLNNIFPIKLIKRNLKINNKTILIYHFINLTKFVKNLEEIMKELISKYGELIENDNNYSVRNNDIITELIQTPNKKYGPYNKIINSNKKLPKKLKRKDCKIIIS